MKKRFILFIAVMLGMCPSWAQLKRDDAFHSKYKLAGVTVFSRHGLRAAKAKSDDLISRLTPYAWHNFDVPNENLTNKGSVLETINGIFFRKWLISEGLFSVNAEPGDSVYVLANSKQRTIATSRYFTSGLLPVEETITVNHQDSVDKSDYAFDGILGDDISTEQWTQLKAEYDAAYSEAAIKKVDEQLKPAYDLLFELLDVKDSPAYKDSTFTGFNTQSTLRIKKNKKPQMQGNIGTACTIMDALRMQYYDEPSSTQTTFGTTLTTEQWEMLNNITNVRNEIRYASPFVQQYLSEEMRQFIADGLTTDGRKFTFICGHDTSIFLILKALHVMDFETTDALGVKIPIGCKIVFEKWTDEAGTPYVAVNLVYQTIDQIHNNTMLDLNTERPVITPLQFEGMETNEDGLIPMDKMTARLTAKLDPASIREVTRSTTAKSAMGYTINGLPAGDNYHGIVVKEGKKMLRKDMDKAIGK